MRGSGAERSCIDEDVDAAMSSRTSAAGTDGWIGGCGRRIACVSEAQIQDQHLSSFCRVGAPTPRVALSLYRTVLPIGPPICTYARGGGGADSGLGFAPTRFWKAARGIFSLSLSLFQAPDRPRFTAATSKATDMQHEEIGSDAKAGPSSYHAGPAIQPPPGMSKNAAKKLARKQKLDATKHERRAAERLKKKENRRVRHLAAQQDAELNDLDRATDASQPAAKRSRLEHAPSQAATKQFFDARLVIDCGFDELMVEKEASSMTQQLMYLYSANRNAKMPFGEIILTGQDAPRDCLRDVHPDQLSLVPDAASTSQPETQAETSFASSASIENNSIGRAMDGKLRGVWRRWKRVTIYKHAESSLCCLNSCMAILKLPHSTRRTNRTTSRRTLVVDIRLQRKSARLGIASDVPMPSTSPPTQKTR